jgi:S-adenosylmethionine synthetase
MYNYTNEAVFRGHPDKICDQISDAILDNCLKQDPRSRVACEVAGGKNKIFITGEITSKAKIDYQNIVNNVLRENDYNNKYKIVVDISQQSQNIRQGVDHDNSELGAGDQGMMIGYATNETKEYLNKAQVILINMIKKYDNLRMLNPEFYGSDGKCQLTGLYDENDNLKEVKIIVFSFNHKKLNLKDMTKAKEKVNKLIIDELGQFYNNEINIYINPTGIFEIGGFDGDAGLTGRKIIADTYQSFARHGGGAFSGKDATKVDRTGAYKARQVAKTIVASGIAKRCEVQIAYSIGMNNALSVRVNTFNTSKINESMLEEIVENNVDFTVSGMIMDLNLLNPRFEETAKYGHFSNQSFEWEQLDKKLEEVLKNIKINGSDKIGKKD